MALIPTDEATVRMCIERLDRHAEYLISEGCLSHASATRCAAIVLQSLLPTPEPPLPMNYIDTDPGRSIIALDVIKRLHGLLTPEEAFRVVANEVTGMSGQEGVKLLAALRLAAKGGPHS